ncbi:SDR family NAD(P)-dependent oxidoreductase [Actinomycetospora chiangmaiensis]|uniref:SDR family NAD(P)-dependent oxidoreductase n=1 Tax=Actinomycetospora chiangmaiensis TaxID=402650 RepID=UPI00037263B6|nr:SDR family NAD(P)-dependent oxidoreductase [Actinomycetospora chiangmaiensis]
MTTIAIIGAGPGLGAATARRFGAEGFDVALVSRNLDRARGLAADLAGEGVAAHGFATDARDPAALARTLESITETVGPIEVLQYSPLPQKDFLRPVLETTAADLVGPVETSIYGPVAAVHQVLPGMRYLKRGTVLFVNGGSGARPAAAVAGTSIAFAGLGAFATMLHDEVAGDGIHVAQLIIPGAIEPRHPRKDPAVLAETLWSMHTGRDEFRVFAEEM